MWRIRSARRRTAAKLTRTVTTPPRRNARSAGSRPAIGDPVEPGVLEGMRRTAPGHAANLRDRCEHDRISRAERNPCTEVDLLITAIADLLGVDPQSLY